MADEKCMTQKLMEGFGLEFPKDARKFAEIFLKSEDGNLDQLLNDLVDSFPEKRESILGVQVQVDDGES